MTWPLRTARKLLLPLRRRLSLLQVTSLLVLCLSVCFEGLAQQRLPVAIPETTAGLNLTNALQDVWPAIGSATNQWAVSIRQLNGWPEARDADIKTALKLAEQGNAPAQLRIGYCFFSGDGLERDYAQAVAWLLKAA